MTKTLRGRKLIVHISGPTTGRVRVSYTARYHNKTITSNTKTVDLKDGRSTVTFKLGARAAAHATIRVSAKLNHGSVDAPRDPPDPLSLTDLEGAVV